MRWADAGPALAERLDREDPLARFRARFHIPEGPQGGKLLYFCGHSLGLQPVDARAAVESALDEWARFGVEGHFRGERPWIGWGRELAELTAPLVGAEPSEVVLMNGLTVNLHLLLVSFYRPGPRRRLVFVERHAFSSDLYALRSHLRLHGVDPGEAIRHLPADAHGVLADPGEVEALFREQGEGAALLLLGGVNYYTGEAYPVERIVRAAHAAGCPVLVDAAHAAGNIPLSLHAWGVDGAVWCSYKYLNGGPGSPGGCFIHSRHAGRVGFPRLEGWWGNREETRFAMDPDFDPAPGAAGWQISNPPVLSFAPLGASLRIFREAGMEHLRAKSILLTGYLEFLLRSMGTDRFRIITPGDPSSRGAQLSLLFPRGGREAAEALRKEGVVCDWRAPGVLRLAPAPLYNTFSEAHRCAALLARILGVGGPSAPVALTPRV
ncbi:MAG: kynureninase [Bacteroidota bacterium]